MTDSPNSCGGPPLLRPIPVRPFNINLKEPTPPGDELQPDSPRPGSTVNIEWLNYKLLDPKNGVRPESACSISRAQSANNLTSSTLMGIYEPTNFGNDKYVPGNGINTPWGAGINTPPKLLFVDESTDIIQKQHTYPPRRASVAHHPAQPAQTTKTALFYSSLRALLLSGLGVIYGIGVATVRGDRSSATLRMEHIRTSGCSWGYMTFWGALGLAMGCLLPCVDGFWVRSSGTRGNGDSTEMEGDVNNKRRRETDWALAVRGMGIFIGIAYAIRKLPWDSTLQVSMFLALVNPALWYLIDGSIPGFLVSSVVGLAGSAVLTGLQPNMVPVPAVISFSSPGALSGTGTVHPNASAQLVDAWPMPLVGIAGQQTLAMGIWTLNVLFCCCVVFGNVGRWLAINKYGPTHV
ncbi:hypothetical protein GGS21DRAFT_511134 [Xylaria nigripes]|nr:hypothetical protein GGS21DRAFT_511134 [Xylaria nigripes]